MTPCATSLKRGNRGRQRKGVVTGGDDRRGDMPHVEEALVPAHDPALAEVDGNTCSSCYVSLPPQMVMQVRAGQSLFCKTCGRLLYMAENK